MTVSRAVLLALALSSCVTSPAFAQPSPSCGPRAEIIKMLAKDFKEVPVMVGLVSDNTIMEILSSKDGASWTMLISYPSNQSCLFHSGSDLSAIPRERPS